MSDIEYKAGQEIWLVYKRAAENKKIISVFSDCISIETKNTHFGFFIRPEEIAPTKEALRIKVFGE